MTWDWLIKRFKYPSLQPTRTNRTTNLHRNRSHDPSPHRIVSHNNITHLRNHAGKMYHSPPVSTLNTWHKQKLRKTPLDSFRDIKHHTRPSQTRSHRFILHPHVFRHRRAVSNVCPSIFQSSCLNCTNCLTDEFKCEAKRGCASKKDQDLSSRIVHGRMNFRVKRRSHGCVIDDGLKGDVGVQTGRPRRRRRRIATDGRRTANSRRDAGGACARLGGATPNTQTRDESVGKCPACVRTAIRGKCKSHLWIADWSWCTLDIAKISRNSEINVQARRPFGVVIESASGGQKCTIENVYVPQWAVFG